MRGEISRVDICVSQPGGLPFCRHPGRSVRLTCHGRTQIMRVQNPQAACSYIILFTFFNFWLCWIFTAVHGLFSACSERRLLSSCGERASHPGGFSLCRAWAPWSLGFGSCGSRPPERRLHSWVAWAQQSQHTRSVVGAHGLRCSMVRGIFLDRGSNLCPLRWQEDALPLSHHRSPSVCIFEQKDTVPLKSQKILSASKFNLNSG